MENELISVIVPVYNVSKYLRQCVDSIIRQTYSYLEIILVDDGSTDESSVLCDELSKANSRIRVIHKENGGLSSARNAGIDAAKGKYLVFIDSDDYISPFMIEKLYKSLKSNAADMSLCSFSYVSEEGIVLDSTIETPITNNVKKGEDIIRNHFFKENDWYWIVVWNKLYKRELFDTLRFPKGKIHEDEFVAHIIYHNCNKVSCISEKLYMYRQRETSIMKVKNAEKYLDAVEAYLSRASFLRTNGYEDMYIIKCLLKAIEKFEKYYVLDSKKLNLNRINFLQKEYRNICRHLHRRTKNLKIAEVLFRNYVGMLFNCRMKHILGRMA